MALVSVTERMSHFVLSIECFICINKNPASLGRASIGVKVLLTGDSFSSPFICINKCTASHHGAFIGVKILRPDAPFIPLVSIFCNQCLPFSDLRLENEEWWGSDHFCYPLSIHFSQRSELHFFVHGANVSHDTQHLPPLAAGCD